VDWKPERAVQAKVRDFQKKEKTKQKKHDYWSVPTRKHSGSACKWRFLKDFLIDGLSPQEVSTSPSTDTLYWVLPRRWPESSLMVLSLMKIVECLYCDVGPLPILLVQSYQVIYSRQVLQIQMSYMQTYIHTFMHISIHAYTIGTRISFIHNCINHLEFFLLTIDQKCLSPFCRITEGQKCHSPLYRKTEYQKHHSPVYRKTECQASFPVLSDYGRSKVSFPVLSEDGMSRISFPGLSKDGMSRISFPGLSEDGMSSIFPRFDGLRKVKSVIPRFIGRRNVKNIIPRFIGRRNVENIIPRFVGRRNINSIIS